MRKSRAFTLIELMVVVAVIGLLIGITMPSLKEARLVARKAVCQKNLQQIGVGIHEYLQIHRDTFFEACRVPWVEATLPVAEQKPPLPVALKTELAGTEVFECPADQIIDEEEQQILPSYDRYYDYDQYAYGRYDGSAGKTSYEWEAQLNGLRLDFKGTRYTAPDGTPILLKGRTMWMVSDFDPFHGGDRRRGSLNTLYMDLHVQSD